MRARALTALAAVMLLAPMSASAVSPPAGPEVPAPFDRALPNPPADGSPWWGRSALDADRTGIHDSLEALRTVHFPVVVVVDYAVSPGDGDVATLKALGLEIGVVLPTLSAVSAVAHSMAEVRAASRRSLTPK